MNFAKRVSDMIAEAVKMIPMTFPGRAMLVDKLRAATDLVAEFEREAFARDITRSGGGLSRRDEFIKSAMQGLLANGDFLQAVGDTVNTKVGAKAAVGKLAIDIADQTMEQADEGKKS